MGHEYCLSKWNCCGCWLSDGSACIHKVLDIFVGHARATLRVKLVSPSELYLVGLSVMLQAIEKHLPGHIGSAQTSSACCLFPQRSEAACSANFISDRQKAVL